MDIRIYTPRQINASAHSNHQYHTHWIWLEIEQPGAASDRITIFVKDADTAERLATAINAAQQPPAPATSEAS